MKIKYNEECSTTGPVSK